MQATSKDNRDSRTQTLLLEYLDLELKQEVLSSYSEIKHRLINKTTCQQDILYLYRKSKSATKVKPVI